MFLCPSPPPLSPSWFLQLLLMLLLLPDPSLTVAPVEPVLTTPPTQANCSKCNDVVSKHAIENSSNSSTNISSLSSDVSNTSLVMNPSSSSVTLTSVDEVHAQMKPHDRQPVPPSQHLPSSVNDTTGSSFATSSNGTEDSAASAPVTVSNQQAASEMGTSTHIISTIHDPPTTTTALPTQSLSPVSATAARTAPLTSVNLTSATTVSTKTLPTSLPIKVTSTPGITTSTAATSPPSPAPGMAAGPTPLPGMTTFTSVLPTSPVPTLPQSTTTPTTKATAAAAAVTTDTTPAKPMVSVTGFSGLGVAGGALTRRLMDTASLLAVLVFGLLFFLVTVAVFVTQAYESYRRKDYTQVDYLINGMYTDSGV